MSGVHRRETDLAHKRLNQFLCENFISGGLAHDPVTAQNGGIGREDHDIAFAVNGLHAVATVLQRVGVGITDIREVDRVPTRTHQIACIIEEAGSTCLCQADDRYTRHRKMVIVAVQQGREVRHIGIRRLQNA